MKQMVFVDIAIYKKFIKKSTIDLVFAMLLLIKSLIICDIAGVFEYYSNY